MTSSLPSAPAIIDGFFIHSWANKTNHTEIWEISSISITLRALWLVDWCRSHYIGSLMIYIWVSCPLIMDRLNTQLSDCSLQRFTNSLNSWFFHSLVPSHSVAHLSVHENAKIGVTNEWGLLCTSYFIYFILHLIYLLTISRNDISSSTYNVWQLCSSL